MNDQDRIAVATDLGRLPKLVHTPGPWRWCGNVDTHLLGIWSMTSGRPFVMNLTRWGMRDAQPVFFDRAEGENPMVCGVRRMGSDIAIREVPYRGDVVGLDNIDARILETSVSLYEAAKAMGLTLDDCVAVQLAERNRFEVSGPCGKCGPCLMVAAVNRIEGTAAKS